MNKSFIILLICTAITSCNSFKNTIDYKSIKPMIIIDSNYFNKLILDGYKGEVSIIDSVEDYKIVIVRWSNGYISIGKMKNNMAIGDWYLLDKKNRLRRYLIISYTGDFLFLYENFSRKGVLENRFKCITPPF